MTAAYRCLLGCLLLAGIATAQTPREPPPPEPPSPETVAKAREAAVAWAERGIEQLPDTIAKLKRRSDRASAEKAAELTAMKAYLEAYVSKQQARGDIEILQARWEREQTPPTAKERDQLQKLDEQYRAAVAAMTEQAAEYKRLSKGGDLPDPINRFLYPEDDNKRARQ